MLWQVFRPELNRSHHAAQHTATWHDYMRLSKENKQAFFERYRSVSVDSFMPKVKDGLVFRISKSIIENLIGGVYAMKLFQPQEEGSHEVTISNELRFNVAVDFISIGMSFRQAASAFEVARQRLKNPLCWLG